jgi:cyanophycinase-like exopeptidase
MKYATKLVRHLCIALGLSLVACAPHTTQRGFQYYLTGNADDVVRDTRGLLVLQGGGDDVDLNYTRMGEYAGGGDFVVLRASGADDYNDYIFALCHCDSVETIVFSDRGAAYDEFVIDRIRNAEALFIAGGDQSNYVRFWKGTPVEDAINFVAAKPAPIGGTSAGMAVMGQFVYSAMTPDSLTSDHALSNPFHEDLTLEKDFLDFTGMENIITDQHLIERDRIGRTVTLLARLLHDGWTTQARAMAADRETAVHLDPVTGIAEIHATANHETPYAYFISTTEVPEVCKPDLPLTMHNISVYRVSPGGTFDVRKWTGTGGVAYTFNVDDGKLSSSRGDIY